MANKKDNKAKVVGKKITSRQGTHYHTEGFIKEITVKDDAPITFTLIPTEAFAFGKDESDGKKMILIKGEPKQEESPEAKLVALGVEFRFVVSEKTDRNVSLLYSLKKDRALVRVAVKEGSESATSSESESENSQNNKVVYPISSITIL